MSRHTDGVVTWLGRIGVATWLAFMASRPTVGVATRKHWGEPNWCRDTPSGVATWLGWARLVLGRDMIFHVAIGQLLGYRDPTFGVATWRLRGGPRLSGHSFWCRDRGVAIRCHDMVWSRDLRKGDATGRGAWVRSTHAVCAVHAHCALDPVSVFWVTIHGH